jgi:hypothetical protein
LSIDTEDDLANDTDWNARFISDSDRDNGGLDKGHTRAPLSEDQIEEKLSELRARKKATRRHRNEIQEQIRLLRTEMKVLTLEKGKLDSVIRNACIQSRNACIQSRNEYSRTSIKNDFAQGIKE